MYRLEYISQHTDAVETNYSEANCMHILTSYIFLITFAPKGPRYLGNLGNYLLGNAYLGNYLSQINQLLE